eukprot:CAMPEP_0118651570 /NCGR_PEP_ID=MMETSP0785-20121206/10856_1 /TAXON_ID=91992 /ORGANISM="Bolidomonas pacifica, Strain CCMP 1866" /LENGTH=288 /DNA_ID=CAMNT_0006544031 /DNA_START=159 /DNA_END=1021 /DNA_ORIENTATION=+
MSKFKTLSSTLAADITGAHPRLHWDLHERRRQLANFSCSRALSGMANYYAEGKRKNAFYADDEAVNSGSVVRRRRFRNWYPSRDDGGKVSKGSKRPNLNFSDIYGNGAMEVYEDDDYWDDDEEEEEEEEQEKAIIDVECTTQEEDFTDDFTDDFEWTEVMYAYKEEEEEVEDWEVLNTTPSFADILKSSGLKHAAVQARSKFIFKNALPSKAPKPVLRASSDDFLFSVYLSSKDQRGGSLKKLFKHARPLKKNRSGEGFTTTKHDMREEDAVGDVDVTPQREVEKEST